MNDLLSRAACGNIHFIILTAVEFSRHIYKHPRPMYTSIHTLHLKVLLVVHGDEVLSVDSVVGSISLNDLTHLERTRLDDTTSDRATETVGTVGDAEVGNVDLVWVAVDDGWGTEEGGVDKVVGDLQLVVTAVVEVLPLQLLVGFDEPVGVVVGGGEGDVLAVWTWRRHGRTGEFDTKGTGTG